MLLGRKARTSLETILKSRGITLPTKVHTVKAMLFASSHVQRWELDHKEGWAPKNWCFQIVVLEMTWFLRALWTSRRSNQSILKEINSENSLEGLMLKLKLQNFGHLMWRALLIGKDPDAGQDWRWEEKGTTEDEMAGWHHWFDGHEFEQALGVGDGQGSLACWSPWGLKESNTTEQLNWTELRNFRNEKYNNQNEKLTR